MNEYNAKGEATEVVIIKRTGDKVTVLIDTEDLPQVLEYNWKVD